MIIDKLIDKIKQTGNPTVVGLDPRLDYIPGYLREEAYQVHGETLKGAAEAILLYNKAIIDQTWDLIPAVKPQIAMYEQFGAEGVAAYIETIRYAKEKGLIVIGDIKRGDIASTAEAYAQGHIGKAVVGSKAYTPFNTDFITVSPYLGFDSIEPYLGDCKAYERGLFVLVKTSNPNSGQLQDLLVEGKPIYEIMGGLVEQWGENFRGHYGFSAIGAVVGATHKEQAARLRAVMPHTFFLVPGYGAQGGKAEDLAVCFDKNGLGAIVNSSRGIIAAYMKEPYKSQFSEQDFALASRQAVLDMKADLLKYIGLTV